MAFQFNSSDYSWLVPSFSQSCGLLFLPSKSLSKVSADSQSVAGPVPLTVRAATRKLYSVPRSRPEIQITTTKKRNNKNKKQKKTSWSKSLENKRLILSREVFHPPSQYTATIPTSFQLKLIEYKQHIPIAQRGSHISRRGRKPTQSRGKPLSGVPRRLQILFF